MVKIGYVLCELCRKFAEKNWNCVRIRLTEVLM